MTEKSSNISYFNIFILFLTFQTQLCAFSACSSDRSYEALVVGAGQATCGALNNSPAVYHSVWAQGGSATNYSYSLYGKDESPKKKRKGNAYSHISMDSTLGRTSITYISSLCQSLNNGTQEPAILMRKKDWGGGREALCPM